MQAEQRPADARPKPTMPRRSLAVRTRLQAGVLNKSATTTTNSDRVLPPEIKPSTTSFTDWFAEGP